MPWYYGVLGPIRPQFDGKVLKVLELPLFYSFFTVFSAELATFSRNVLSSNIIDLGSIILALSPYTGPASLILALVSILLVLYWAHPVSNPGYTSPAPTVSSWPGRVSFDGERLAMRLILEPFCGLVY